MPGAPGFDGKIGSGVQCRLVLGLDGNGRFMRVAEMLGIDLTDAGAVADLERCRSRISALGSLPDGWHDGHGKAPTPEAIRSAYRVLARNPGLAVGYRIFPTSGGGLLFEFSHGGWDYSVEIEPGGGAGIYGIRDDGEGEMEAGVLDVDGAAACR